MRQVMPHRNNIGAQPPACKSFLAFATSPSGLMALCNAATRPDWSGYVENNFILNKPITLATALQRLPSRSTLGDGRHANSSIACAAFPGDIR